MKKLILLTSLLVTQASFASSSEKVNECFARMKALTDSLIASGEEKIESNGSANEIYNRSTKFIGIEPGGKSCEVSIGQTSYPDNFNGDLKAHDDIYVGVLSNRRTNVGFSMNTYYDYTITGIPGGPSKVNFKVNRCDIDLNNLNAKVIFSSTDKKTVQIINKGDGIIEFKTSEDGIGILRLLGRTLSHKCTVDLNNQK